MHKPFSSDIFHFTGKERDQETGNDYFKYRYLSSSAGRWLSPDPLGLTRANLEDPQSLNIYSYVGDNPLTRIDLQGLCWRGFHWARALGKKIGHGFAAAYRWLSKPAPKPKATVTTSLTNTTVESSGTSNPQGNTPSKPTCNTGFNFGVTGGTDGGLGVAIHPLQAAALGGGSAGLTFGGATPIGAYASASGGAAAGPWGAPSQKGNLGALGGGAAAGAGITFGNATSAGQMHGKALTFGGGVDAGVGGGVQLTLGTDAAGNTIWQVNITGGFGLKFYGYSLMTHTVAVSTNGGC